MDDTEFTKIVETYADTIFRIGINYTKNRTEAEDIVQIVLLKLYQANNQFLDESHIRNWLIRVTINECKHLLRSSWWKTRLPETALDHISFEKPEQSDLFLAVLDLPEKYRIVVYLYYYENYSIREIAQLLQSRESTIQTRLMRARTRLKQSLLEVWQDEQQDTISTNLFPAASFSGNNGSCAPADHK